MSYAQGLATGYAVGAQFGEGINKGIKNYQQRQIAKELTKDYGTEVDEELKPEAAQVAARVQQGQQEAAAVQQLPGQAPAPKPAGLMLSKPGPYKPATPELDNITSGNVLGTAADAATRTPEQAAAELTKTRKVRVENPMQNYLRYQGAAAKAAELGDLDLNKAYTDMAQAAYKTDLTRAAATAFSALKTGNVRPLEQLMSSDFIPNGYKYKNMTLLPNGDVEADIIGAEGKTTRDVIPQAELLQGVNLLTNPEFLGKMAEADIKTRMDQAQALQKLQSDMFLKKLGFQYDTALEGQRQAGQDRRKAADLAMDEAKLAISRFSAENTAWYRSQLLGDKAAARAENQLNDAVKDLPPEQRMLAIGMANNGVKPQVAAGMAAAGLDKFTITYDPKEGTGVRYAPMGNAFVRMPPKAFLDATEPDPELRAEKFKNYVGSVTQALGPEATRLVLAQDDKTASRFLAERNIDISGGDFKRYAVLAQEQPKATGGGPLSWLVPTPQQVQRRITAEKNRPAPAPAAPRGFSLGAGPMAGARTLDYPNR